MLLMSINWLSYMISLSVKKILTQVDVGSKETYMNGNILVDQTKDETSDLYLPHRS